MKDAYFSAALLPSSRKRVHYQWSANIYEFLCLCFGLGPAPRIFTRILKISITILFRIVIRIIIHISRRCVADRTNNVGNLDGQRYRNFLIAAPGIQLDRPNPFDMITDSDVDEADNVVFRIEEDDKIIDFRQRCGILIYAPIIVSCFSFSICFLNF